jgi:uncharacterized protein (TIGR01777 family)
MTTTRNFQASIELPVSAREAFDWHERPGAFERLTPPWQDVDVIERSGGIRDGARVVLRLRMGPASLRWVVEHRDYEPGVRFRDVQIKGPFARWEHEHRFEPVNDEHVRLVDDIDYAPPLGALGGMLGGSKVDGMLRQLFTYRHAITRDDLTLHGRFADRPRLRVAITGSSGLIGSALRHLLTTGGHDVLLIVRRPPRDENEVQWDPESGLERLDALEGIDAVVHLAGESIAERWNDEKRRRIRHSRVQGTGTLCAALAQLQQRPRVLVSASAIGYYGNRDDEVLTETSAAGRMFLSDVCKQWEEACDAAREAGVRVVHPRFGMVLSPRGGALAKMLTPFRLGAGGAVGKGNQYWSWISLDDAISAVSHALMNDQIAGPMNVVSPNPVTSRTFARTLARVLNRFAFAPLPASAARLALGPMADELLLASARVQPTVLLDHDYEFRDPQLEPALRRMLGRMQLAAAAAPV